MILCIDETKFKRWRRRHKRASKLFFDNKAGLEVPPDADQFIVMPTTISE